MEGLNCSDLEGDEEVVKEDNFRFGNSGSRKVGKSGNREIGVSAGCCSM